MPTIEITVSTQIADTPRVEQVRGMFDLPETPHSTLQWKASLPLEERNWNIGLICGPSGCGKSTLARRLWPKAEQPSHLWPHEQSVLDGFPDRLPIKDVVEIMSSVGFSSPPTWLRPFHVLSTGQQFRVTLARLIAEARHTATAATPIVFDEYTSVVDRTVAQIGSSALAKTIRKHHLRFVAVTCHEDIEPWLQPDWIYRPDLGTFQWRLLRRRPAIELTLVRCAPSAWGLFAPHHYLSTSINPSSTCWLACWKDKPVAFTAWLPFVGAGPPTRREHRTVCLPDYQGAGIGNALTNTVASMWRTFGYRAISTTTHPGMIAYRHHSGLWRLTRAPSLGGLEKDKRFVNLKHATTRLTAGFEYTGPALARPFAFSLLSR